MLGLIGGGSTHHKVMGGDYMQTAGGKLVFQMRFACNLTMLPLAALLPPPIKPSIQKLKDYCQIILNCAKLRKYGKKPNKIVKTDVQTEKHMV